MRPSSYRLMGELVSRLEHEGPEPRKIAREMGLNEATVRLWIKKNLVGRGFGLHASVAFDRIGLQHIMTLATVAKAYRPAVQTIFAEMSEAAYLHYYVPLLDGTFLIDATVPPKLFREYSSFISGLKAAGFFSSVEEILPFAWSRPLPMKVNSYDFRSDTWELDLKKEVERREITVTPHGEGKFDATDLMIVRRLQVDARISLKAIGRRHNIKYKKVLRHYRHVVDRKLLPFYGLNWIRSSFPPKSNSARNPTHSYVLLELLVKDVSRPELGRLMLTMHRLPFLWCERGGQHYTCEIPIPIDMTNEVFTYLRDALADFQGRTRIMVGTTGIGPMTFSIQPELYDQAKKRWTFDPPSFLKRVEEVLLTVKR